VQSAVRRRHHPPSSSGASRRSASIRHTAPATRCAPDSPPAPLQLKCHPGKSERRPGHTSDATLNRYIREGEPLCYEWTQDSICSSTAAKAQGLSTATLKQHMAAVRMLFDHLVTGGVIVPTVATIILILLDCCSTTARQGSAIGGGKRCPFVSIPLRQTWSR
jgi:hypothetical protein